MSATSITPECPWLSTSFRIFFIDTKPSSLYHSLYIIASSVRVNANIKLTVYQPWVKTHHVCLPFSLPFSSFWLETQFPYLWSCLFRRPGATFLLWGCQFLRTLHTSHPTYPCLELPKPWCVLSGCHQASTPFPPLEHGLDCVRFL